MFLAMLEAVKSYPISVQTTENRPSLTAFVTHPKHTSFKLTK